ncbi:MAG: ATP-dependent sacrificial sulfur transferase LarE [Planctomycetota bacterium]|nr:ATP-dependent sacrificial sulfur transferase LarE [Planctomycetota bacterium]
MSKRVNARGFYEILCERMGLLKTALVAYSGGVDSTVVAKAAKDTGIKFLSVFCDSPLVPKYLKKQAKEVARELDLPLLVIYKDELKDERFCANPKERCYICKSGLFEILRGIASKHRLNSIAVGTNADDVNDVRPGMRAEEEYGVVRPLLECGIGKRGVRAIARYLGLSNAGAPSEACLASRIPFGSLITFEKLRMVEKAEDFLRRLGFAGCRVRNHEGLARIELRSASEFRRMGERMRSRIHNRLKRFGFEFVTLDALGYRNTTNS